MNNLTYFVYVPILGILIAALLHSINTRQHEKRRIFNDKANEFVKAFKPELEALFNRDDGPTDLRGIKLGRGRIFKDGVDLMLHNAFGKHQAAIIEFSLVLNGRQRRRLDKIWVKYCTAINSKIDGVQNKKLLIIGLIQNFFRIAKCK